MPTLTPRGVRSGSGGYSSPEELPRKPVQRGGATMARGTSGSSTSRQKSRGSGSKSSGSQSKRSSTRASRKPSSASSNGQRSSRSKRSGQDVPDYSLVNPDEIKEAVDVYLDAPVVSVTRSSSR